MKLICISNVFMLNFFKMEYAITPGKTYDAKITGDHYFLKDDQGDIKYIDKSLFKTIELHRQEILNELGI